MAVGAGLPGRPGKPWPGAGTGRPAPTKGPRAAAAPATPAPSVPSQPEFAAPSAALSSADLAGLEAELDQQAKKILEDHRRALQQKLESQMARHTALEQSALLEQRRKVVSSFQSSLDSVERQMDLLKSRLESSRSSASPGPILAAGERQQIEAELKNLEQRRQRLLAQRKGELDSLDEKMRSRLAELRGQLSEEMEKELESVRRRLDETKGQELAAEREAIEKRWPRLSLPSPPAIEAPPTPPAEPAPAVRSSSDQAKTRRAEMIRSRARLLREITSELEAEVTRQANKRGFQPVFERPARPGNRIAGLPDLTSKAEEWLKEAWSNWEKPRAGKSG